MITIIDYGLGNVSAFGYVYEDIGVPFDIIDSPEKLNNKVTHIIIPGVGSFDNAMRKLIDSGFAKRLNILFHESQVKIFGVCSGLQIMCKSSQEGSLKGLGWLDAEVVRISNKNDSGQNIRLPHMGWNKIINQKKCPLVKDCDQKEFYFLHSYYINCNNQGDISSTVVYNYPITASVASDRIYGTQFHPEKSHTQGKTILNNFANL